MINFLLFLLFFYQFSTETQEIYLHRDISISIYVQFLNKNIFFLSENAQKELQN